MLFIADRAVLQLDGAADIVYVRIRQNDMIQKDIIPGVRVGNIIGIRTVGHDIREGLPFGNLRPAFRKAFVVSADFPDL